MKEAKAFPVEVTVYQSRAIIKSEAEIELEEGDNLITIKSFPLKIMKNTLIVYKDIPNDNFFIKEFEINEITERVIDKEKVGEAKEKLKKLKERMEDFMNEAEILNKKIQFYEQVINRISKESSKEAPFRVEIDKLKDFLEFIDEGLSKEYQKKRKIERKINEIEDEIRIIESRLKGAERKDTRRINVVNVRLEARKKGKYKIAIKYITPYAWWAPYYEILFDSKNDKIEGRFYGIVSQMTGEDWEDVRLSIATGSPKFDVTLPEPLPWILEEQPRYEFQKRGRVEHYSMVIEEKKEVYKEEESLPIREIEISELGVKLNLKDKFTIPDHAQQKKVLIKTLNLEKVKSYYTVVPAVNSYAYLTIEFRNNDIIPMMPGECGLYVDGDYTGKIKFKENISPGEKIKTSFGIDENIKINRKLIYRKKGEKGILRSKVYIDFCYKIEMENYKKREILLLLKESIPFSENEKIQVELYDANYAPSRIEDRGIYVWEIKLNTGEKKSLIYKFRIIYPEEIKITGI